MPRYLELLAAGGSRSPEDLAAIAGLDLADPSFWAKGLDLVREQLEAAEAAAAEGQATSARAAQPAPGGEFASLGALSTTWVLKAPLTATGWSVASRIASTVWSAGSSCSPPDRRRA